MKKSVTFRLDPALLADARRCATLENRSLTNFVETVLKQRIEAMGPGALLAESPGSGDIMVTDAQLLQGVLAERQA